MNKIWQSYVWHSDKCFFVSTISRNYELYDGIYPGIETMAWEFNNKVKGKLIYQSDRSDHAEVCQRLIDTGSADE